MSAWIKTPTGVSGSLYGKRIWIDKLRFTKIGAKARYRLTIEQMPQEEIPDKGYVATIKTGKELAFSVLKNLSEIASQSGGSLQTPTSPSPAANLLVDVAHPDAGAVENTDTEKRMTSTYPHFSRPVISKK